MRHVRDALLHAPTLGYVLVGRDPSAVAPRLVHQRDDAAVVELDHGGDRATLRQRGHEIEAILLRVAVEGSGRGTDGEEIPQGAARPHQVAREPVHLQVAVVAHDEPLGGIEHAQALGHVVEGLFQHTDAVARLVLARRDHGRELPAEAAEHGCDEAYEIAKHAHPCPLAYGGPFPRWWAGS